MNGGQKSRTQKKLLWPLAAIILGALVSTNPFYEPRLSPGAGITAWFADMALVLIFLTYPIIERLVVIVTGLFFAVPCFLWAPPLARGLLMCCMAFPFAIAATSLFAPPTAGFRARLAFFFTWLGTQRIEHRTRSFDVASLLHLIAATVVLGAAVACVKSVPAFGFWLVARWLAGGIMVLAFAEMATAGQDFLTASLGLRTPSLMRSPVLSTSVGEFWTKRWNVTASAVAFRPLVFAPLAQRGIVVALFATFLASAIGHVLLAYMAMGRWPISLICGAFFLVQPLLILVERRMRVRRWPVAAARAWTLSALAITSPLFVEPGIELVAPSWGATKDVLMPTMFVFGFSVILNVFFSIGQLVSCPRFMPPNPALEPTRIAATSETVSSRVEK
ncbi:MAG TPA: MBOAT family protein [Verrucomicrobiae bacterium]|jgi:hypothetical protein|nr:MBOAT family protein [Verrucomicrobiae bacterium]